MRETIGKVMMWAGSALSVLLEWMNSNAAALGVVFAAAGFVLTWYYQRERTRIAQRLAEQTLAVRESVSLDAVCRIEEGD